MSLVVLSLPQTRSATPPRRLPPHQSRPVSRPSASSAPAPPPIVKEQRRPWVQGQDKMLLDPPLYTGDRPGSRGIATAVAAPPSLAESARGPAVKVNTHHRLARLLSALVSYLALVTCNCTALWMV
jgi:hypothetical protein